MTSTFSTNCCLLNLRASAFWRLVKVATEHQDSYHSNQVLEGRTPEICMLLIIMTLERGTLLKTVMIISRRNYFEYVRDNLQQKVEIQPSVNELISRASLCLGGTFFSGTVTQSSLK